MIPRLKPDLWKKLKQKRRQQKDLITMFVKFELSHVSFVPSYSSEQKVLFLHPAVFEDSCNQL